MNLAGPNVADPRRRALMGAVGALILTGAKAPPDPGNPPACIVTPAQTEGPYFVDRALERSDIRADPESGAVKLGVPLALTLRVMAVSGKACGPLAGALVDVWHCDAQGVYSGVGGSRDRFLRGHQVSDAQGRVRFMSIYPGWYPGRAAHIHFKIRDAAGAARGFEFTSQLYFDEAVNERVFARAPYARPGGRVRNDADGGFRASGGRLTLALTPDGQGYTGLFDIGVRRAA